MATKNKLNFQVSVSNFLFLAVTIFISCGWIRDHWRLVSLEKQSKNRLADSQRMLFRWNKAENEFRLQNLWKSLERLAPNERIAKFDAFLSGKLNWLLHEAFYLEETIDEIHGMDGYVVEELEKLLTASGDAVKSPDEIHQQLASAFANEPQAELFFPHLLDAKSDEYFAFKKFLHRIWDSFTTPQ